MWYCKIIFGSLLIFSSCSEKKGLTICDCIEINIALVHDPLDDLNSFTKKLIKEEFGEEYLACEKIISDWKIKLSNATEEEKTQMIKSTEGCIMEHKAGKGIKRNN